MVMNYIYKCLCVLLCREKFTGEIRVDLSTLKPIG